MNRRTAVLGFHKIGAAPGGWETWSYVPETAFERQLSYLRDRGWQVLDLDAFLRGLADPNVLPERSALITFDDGYRSNLLVAVPWLRKFGFPSVIFVPTAFVGGRNSFDSDEFIEPEEPICDWDDLRKLERAGVSVQSHGISHRRFSELIADEQRYELQQSKRLIEEQLDKQVDAFAFPYGNSGSDSPQIEQMLAEAGYRAAFLYGGGPVGLPALTVFRLTRIAVGPDTDLAVELDPGRE